jgi:hypothetical protein
MDILDYYNSVYPQLKNCFSMSNYFIAIEKTLIEESGADPAFPSVTYDKESLYYITAKRGFQVHLPVLGDNAVLAPFDYELFLCKDQNQLFQSRQSHEYFFKGVWPVINYIKDIFLKRGMPFMLDYTASGGHILFYNPLHQESSDKLAEIGYLEEGLIKNCSIVDKYDHRRRSPTPLKMANVFSGVTRLAEYIALLAMNEFRGNLIAGKLPVTVSDSQLNCINLDNSWAEGSPVFRCIRSPYSLHKKNYEKYGYRKSPLVDVVGMVFDGTNVYGNNNMGHILDCMWDLGKAADYAQKFTGHIPNANNTLIDFINEYKASELYAFHQDFDNTPDIEPGMAIHYAKEVPNLSDVTRWMLHWPNPMCLQPINMVNLIKEFVIWHNWKPRNVANILRDVYSNKEHGWVLDFESAYPSDEKANFWTRTYAALALIETGAMHIG